MNLLAKFRAKVAHDEKVKEKSTLTLWEEYRQILERNEQPREKDTSQLLRLVNTLGISPQEVELHLVAIAEIARLRPDVEALSDRQYAVEKALENLRSCRIKTKRAVEAGMAADQAANDAERLAQRSRNLTETQGYIERQFPQLFGAQPPAPDDTPVTDATPAIQSARRRLGLGEPT